MKEALAGLRLAITLPPRHFFGGVDRFRALDTAEALRRLGATVFEFETHVAYSGDQEVLRSQIDGLKGFKADAILSASQAGYILQAGMYNHGTDEVFHSQNHFFDVPGLRMIMYWDHVIPQMARFIVNRWPSQPSNSGEGVLSRMRDILRHPRMAHFIPDSGHVLQLQKMQVVSSATDYSMVTSIPRVFLQSGDKNSSRVPKHQVAFFGNLYLAAAKDIEYGDHPAIEEIRASALSALQKDWGLPPFHAYADAVEATDHEARTQLRLHQDQTFYWRFLFDELSVVANGEPRFLKINSLQRPICYFGGFADMQSRNAAAAAGWIICETAPYGAALAALYSTACISIDVVNAPFIAGFSPKLFECYAAGGFMLTSPCTDLVKAIGDLADSITFSSAEELRAKVDWYLGRPHERQQIAREIREIVRRDHMADSLLTRTIPMALDMFDSRTNR
jgi:hypothetical protein